MYEPYALQGVGKGSQPRGAEKAPSIQGGSWGLWIFVMHGGPGISSLTPAGLPIRGSGGGGFACWLFCVYCFPSCPACWGRDNPPGCGPVLPVLFWCFGVVCLLVWWICFAGTWRVSLKSCSGTDRHGFFWLFPGFLWGVAGCGCCLRTQ
jgi:hypothetical protein